MLLPLKMEEAAMSKEARWHEKLEKVKKKILP